MTGHNATDARGVLLTVSRLRASVRNGALLRALDAPVADWTAAADKLIGAGVTRIERDRVATVLAELADGTAPSTIARKVGVGYATVARIAGTMKRLQVTGASATAPTG
jgi:hypothetical protein